MNIHIEQNINENIFEIHATNQLVLSLSILNLRILVLELINRIGEKQ